MSSEIEIRITVRPEGAAVAEIVRTDAATSAPPPVAIEQLGTSDTLEAPSPTALAELESVSVASTAPPPAPMDLDALVAGAESGPAPLPTATIESDAGGIPAPMPLEQLGGEGAEPSPSSEESGDESGNGRRSKKSKSPRKR